MILLTPWLGAILLYALFLAWYQNWRGPLNPVEIETYLARLQKTNGGNLNDLTTIRRFLETDDGKEFFMLNIVRLHQAAVANPETGALEPARKLMARYTNPFMRALFARGGHPAIASRIIGGYVDAWGDIQPDPGWTIMGYMRYRSRRDMAELATSPDFDKHHAFKIAAMPQTFSMPTSPMLMLLMSPRIWVGLILALAASLATNILVMFG